MALNQESRSGPGADNFADVIIRPIPFLVGLWRQLGAEPSAKPLSSDQPELFAALQSEIIPRLMIASRMPALPRVAHRSSVEVRGMAFSASEQDAFVEALLSEDSDRATQLADAHIARGHETSSLLVQLFAPAARELGEMWANDRVSFVDVTIGVCRLHEIVHRISGDAVHTTDLSSETAPSILIASAPGEQHVFGVLVASELFRQNGWAVTSDTSGDPATLLRTLSNHRFDMAGLSVASDLVAGDLRAIVSSWRKASRNNRLKILAGGHLFQHSPHIALEIGADAIAGSGLDAPDLARKLLAMS
ncbi:B12-binding domain-containing protein [Hyphomonas sp.]|uniref:cobalamin B12-binding domain-containing protein n=1 Tax=Hyphomonas sp. TaxID=87 RepID=UPI00391DB8F5